MLSRGHVKRRWQRSLRFAASTQTLESSVLASWPGFWREKIWWILMVSREEAVLKGVLNWLKISKDREGLLAMLLPLLDFHSISVENLLRLGRLPVPGLNGDHLHRRVKDALQAPCRKKSQSQQSFRPKRRCLQHWSPDWGGSKEFSGQQVHPACCFRLRWHEGAIYALDFHDEVFCWKPGDPSTQVRKLLGKGATVTGINDQGTACDFRDLCISPTGEIFVADFENDRLVSFHNGVGHLVLDELQDCENICCSPNGVLYVLTCKALQKLEGSRLQAVVTFPEDLQFSALSVAMFATKEEVIYVLDDNDRLLRLNPAESFEPVVVGQVPTEHEPDLRDLFVTEGGTIYVADHGRRKVLAIRPGDATFTEVLECPGELRPVAVLVQDRSLYVSMRVSNADCMAGSPAQGGLYEYKLPPELQLEWKATHVV